VAEKRTPVSKLSFSEAVGEVEAIVARLENEEIDIDELAGEVRRAIELVTACRARLERTGDEVRELVTRLQEAAPAPAAEEDASL
jgi:exodeoxyribonuclease VII small subunit